MDSLLQLISEHRYVVIFLTLLADAVGLPIPGELTLAIAGSLVARGKMHFGITLSMALAGLLVGDLLLFALGRSVGQKRREKAVHWYCRWVGSTLGSEHCYTRAHQVLSRFRTESLLWLKFIVGARMFAPSLAGMSGVRYGRYLLYDGLGSAGWIGCFLGLGYFLNERLPSVERFLQRSGEGLVLVLATGIVAALLFKLYRRKRFGAAVVRIAAPGGQGSTEDS